MQNPTPIPGLRKEEDEDEDEDETKENSQPARKSKKTVSLPTTSIGVSSVPSGRVRTEVSRSRRIPVATR